MNGLTFKEIAPYLPYDLSYQYNDSKGQPRQDIFDFQDFSVMIFATDNIKLVLRPMSDLITEIEINGIKITPIVKLAKIIDGDSISDIKVKTDGKIFGIKYLDSDSIETVFSYHTGIGSFGMHTPSDERFHLVTNQLELFQKLFEWHFDVFGLLEKNLAVKL